MRIAKALIVAAFAAWIFASLGNPLPANALAACSCDYCATHPTSLCYLYEVGAPAKCPYYTITYCP